MSNKLLVISGPTATGKTALAVKLAKKYNGELISADSRQIYIGLDIGVGKDHPVGTPIHLIDIITPDKTFSVAQFQSLALDIINEIHSRGHLPIVVGCSGLYVNSLISTFSTFHIRPFPLLRFILNRLPLRVLQFLLKLLQPSVFASLNHSDINNPYRLIRKIEISLSRQAYEPNHSPFDILHLSLTAPSSYLFPRIDQRVEDRLKLGHLKELNSLRSHYPWSAPALSVSAYKCLRSYLENKSTLSQSITAWKIAEHQDAKHQKTYFQKIKPALFIDISHPDYVKNACLLVKKWYNLSNETNQS
ncbi:MAG: tRNA (adenosine(37)-N6)-dimethylallyltransferase MiaA [Candidatus Shapirobacteria bacterium]